MKNTKNQKQKQMRGARRPLPRGERSLSRTIQREIGRRLSTQRMISWSSGEDVPPVRKSPKRPMAGAEYSTRVLLESFTLETGLTNGFLIAPTPTTSLFGSIAVEFQDLPQSSSFLSVFDQYRVDKLHFRITPQVNTISPTTASPNAVVPRLFVVVDRDDATVPTTLSQLREYDNCLDILPYQGLSVEFEPSCTPAVYSNSAFSGYEVAPSGDHWIDAASGAVPFYGLKFGCDPTTTGATAAYNWYVDCYAYVSFKNTR
jgi:hypothetical protein